MSEKTKAEENSSGAKALKDCAEKNETVDEAVWSKDQQRKSYYYDDAYGYEVYNPDEEEDEDED
jgi:hypothetical protein